MKNIAKSCKWYLNKVALSCKKILDIFEKNCIFAFEKKS